MALLRAFQAAARERHRVSGLLVRSADAGEGADSRAFCAGGDVKSLLGLLLEGDCGGGEGREAIARSFLTLEYSALLALKALSAVRPVVTVGSGVVMGAGAGLFMGGSRRLVTETTTFAMPECAIGICPDAGSTAFLSGVGRGTARFLSLTGARLGAAEAISLGLATHAVPAWHIATLLEEMRTAGEHLEGVNGEVHLNSQAISNAVQCNAAGTVAAIGDTCAPGSGEMLERGEGWADFQSEVVDGIANSQFLEGEMDRVFGGDALGPSDVAAALEGEKKKNPPASVWVDVVLEALSDGSQSPSSQIIAAALLDCGSRLRASLDNQDAAGVRLFAEALRVERDTVAALAATADFEEGVQCAIGERKGEAPSWSAPDWAAAASRPEVAALLSTLGAIPYGKAAARRPKPKGFGS
uniref:3-hydroxyisobutyryl-CoA hydrolase n=1 Tax=Phaeomonas parva TaxID=124430 RepID=A0A7S1Y0S6_9STRA|mmetsp:Transcript_8035/g.22938  ORF Transcript_8035/g.22938 Transcript_8035/m.22938 type:complete len:413 (+) Transcript_8035:185-1423(+)